MFAVEGEPGLLLGIIGRVSSLEPPRVQMSRHSWLAPECMINTLHELFCGSVSRLTPYGCSAESVSN